MSTAEPDATPDVGRITDGARMVAACTSGDERAVRELLRETPPLARQVLGGPLAPLHYAVREGHASIVRLLLQHGADAHAVVEHLCRVSVAVDAHFPLRLDGAAGFHDVPETPESQARIASLRKGIAELNQEARKGSESVQESRQEASHPIGSQPP